MSRPAIFLDRDGVLNEMVRGGPPRTVAALVIVTGAAAALGRLRDAGFALVAVTNQPDIARGLVDEATVAEINGRLEDALGLDAVVTCPHDGSDACPCRKPAPGLLLGAARQMDLDLGSSWMVGDRWVDIAAGEAAGVRTVLVEHDASWAPTSAGPPPSGLVPQHRVTDLGAAAEVILGSA